MATLLTGKEPWRPLIFSSIKLFTSEKTVSS